MAGSLYPTVFFSISDFGTEILDFMKTQVDFNSDLNSRYVRWISCSNDFTLTSNIEDKQDFQFPGKHEENKTENYALVSQHRSDFISFFQSGINDIFTNSNRNYATENNFNLRQPQIVVLGAAEDPNLSPLIIPLLQSAGNLPQSPAVHLILLYNQNLHKQSSKEASCYKSAFLRELEALKSKQLQAPLFVWLVDIVNEKEFNLDEKENLYNAVAKFSEALLKDAGNIQTATINHAMELGKPCMYSTFGYSLLTFPSQKIKDYVSLYASENELENLVKDFDKKYERITLAEELGKFSRNNGFDEIPKKLAKKNDNENIFKEFSFGYKKYVENEREQVLYKKIGKVETPDTLSVTTSASFFSEIDNYEREYKDKELSEFAGNLQVAKNREIEACKGYIINTQKELIDQKGINYSLIFTSLLANNESSVLDLLEGKYVNFESINSLEDTFRGLFIGKFITARARKLKVESDNYTNKQQLVEKNKKRIESCKEALASLEKKVGTDNADYAKISAEVEALEQEITRLNGDIEKHNIEVKDLKHQIEQIKSDFDRDAYKEGLKAERNKANYEELSEVPKRVASIDDQLKTLYNAKNTTIDERKKFILRDLIIIPAAAFAVVSIIIMVLFFKVDTFNFKLMMYSFGISLLVALVYYIYAGINFWGILKKLNGILDDIGSGYKNKSAHFTKYIKLKNEIYQNDFEFDKDLLALSIAGGLQEEVKKFQVNLENFKEQIVEKNNELKSFKEEFAFADSSFEFCVVDKKEVETIYDNGSIVKVLGSANSKLSSFYQNYLDTGDISNLFMPINAMAEEINERKIEPVSLRSVLFNESDYFPNKVKTEAKFEQLFNTSRPLLRTVSWPGVMSPDVPYTQNILIGKSQTAYDKYLDHINWASTEIDRDNDKVFGVLSIKSNFPGFLIYDVETNEELIRNMDSKEVSKYFINEKYKGETLIPNISSVDADHTGAHGLDSSLIIALSNGLIEYNETKEKFTHKIMGDLGFNFEELINTWNSPVCYEIQDEAKERDEEILRYEDEEYQNYCEKFKKFWIDIPVKVPAKYESEIEGYFFSIKGKSEDWDQIKKVFKNKRRAN